MVQKFAIFLMMTLSAITCGHCAELPMPSTAKLRSLYNSLDPTSITQHLAFYELYPATNEGRQALHNVYVLLYGHRNFQQNFAIAPQVLQQSVDNIVAIVNKSPNESTLNLSDASLATIDTFTQRLANRRLRGYYATSEADVLKLSPQEIDLARGMLLSQLGDSPESLRQIRSYEATMDLMALQILARLKTQASPKEKIRAINHYIFEEMGFRFPPHSAYAKDIDLYTFLPSVLDSRRGVCLGVSILYLCLAQRLDLNLEIVTPPGHIFVRWREGDNTINIETTARGVHLPDEEYLGIDTRSLELRDIKETIGLAHINQAAIYWARKEYDQVKASYEKATPYLPDNKSLQTLLGYAELILGNVEAGERLLKGLVDHIPDEAVSKESIPEDYFAGNVSSEDLKSIFLHVDKTRASLLEKKQALEEVLVKHPKFREGIFSLAGTWLQLHRTQEALSLLEKFHKIDPNNATVEYYLAAIYAERRNYNLAWDHLHQAEKLVAARDHKPKTLDELRQELAKLSPE